MKKVMLVCGARPNFMKVSPILKAMNGGDWEPILVHTGQHYDFSMSRSFFDLLKWVRELKLSKPAGL